MAVTVELAWDEGGAIEVSDGASRELIYIISGTSDREEALEKLNDEAEPTVGGLVAASVSVERITETQWRGVVRYGMLDMSGGSREPSLKPGEAEFQLDTSGGTQKRLTSISTVQKRVIYNGTVSDAAPNFKNFVNVQRDGSVAGVEVGLPVAAFRIERAYSVSEVTSAYIKKLFEYAWCVNSAVVTLNINGVTLSFQPGELLFKGGTANKRNGENVWRVAFNFAFQQNETDLTVGEITGINKRGWDYIWFITYDEAETVTIAPGVTLTKKVTKPRAAYVEQVYRYKNLNDLAL